MVFMWLHHGVDHIEFSTTLFSQVYALIFIMDYWGKLLFFFSELLYRAFFFFFFFHNK
jgi:hypothetical protein